MRILFLIFFGLLIYRFLIRPFLLGMNHSRQYAKSSRHNQMAEMLRRMREQEQHTYRENPSHTAKKRRSNKTDDGEYVDYEEVD